MLLYILNLCIKSLSSKLIPSLILYTLTLHIQIKEHGEVGLATCTAVYVSPTTALTAAHCMEDTTGKMWAKNSDNKSFKISILTIDKKADLCLIKIEAPWHAYASIGLPVKRGDKICLVSSENNTPHSYAEGIVENIMLDNERVISLVHSASILQGASGSGLFNERGELVGINTATYKALTNAVDVTEIDYFLHNILR